MRRTAEKEGSFILPASSHVQAVFVQLWEGTSQLVKAPLTRRGRERWVIGFFSLSEHCVKVQLSFSILHSKKSWLGKSKKRLLLANTQWEWYGQERSFFQTNSAASTTYQVMEWLCRSCQLPYRYLCSLTPVVIQSFPSPFTFLIPCQGLHPCWQPSKVFVAVQI